MKYDADAPRWADMYRDGMSIEAISLEVGVSTGTARKYLHKLGVEMRSAYGPKGANSNRADAVTRSRSHLEPSAAIVRSSVRRAYR